MANEINSVIDKLTPLLSALAEKLGTTGEYLWGVLIRHEIVAGIVSMVWATLSLAIIVVGIFFLRWLGMEDVDDGDSAAVAGVAIMIILIMCFVFVISLDNSIKSLAIPEYYALQEILKVLK